ncbi:50S ribosomal protein L3 N(5)-glutamine methyltransferase [Granulosicoccus antarcticus]|uniref:50S ribosomal protein L3 glutamine methyltransferase n=1 Tax=Granulosicoccus antarcticus IMCC3135 TaxID=1192854 RepID=A0A2Z2NUJ7_9GAMM|nr:50S ribosomal protein L3 N(5)-glutamine methyltransferase [Granulosicoccus antarcticus]ASJ75242.1 50S ribosomal protein L3 glutamine methyltransferase [Granulosicoccus antarcticus IMCC3135]
MVLLSDNEYTIEVAIRRAAQAFEDNDLHYGHGTETALDEASWLVLHALGLSPAIEPDYTQKLTAAQIADCNSLLERRIAERIPAAYLTGQGWFAGRAYLSDKRALVPRSPMAEFIADDFYGALDGIDSPRILDLCTGGGCIAIACAYARTDAIVDASDLSADALALAAQNVELHEMQDRVELLEGSLFEPVSNRYSLIISNPPYVDAADIAAMASEFSHEPMMGLEAGDDGLDLVRIMLRDAADYLEPKGVLVVEVGNSGEALEAAFPSLEFAWLEFANGGYGVFMLTREELLAGNIK